MIKQDIDWAEDWCDITFEEELKIVGFTRGRSAVNIDAKSTTKEEYFTIFLVDFFDMLQNGDIKDMIISGTFEVKKRGRDFGIRLQGTPKRDSPKVDYFYSNRPIPRYV